MIPKIPAKVVETIFEHKNWIGFGLTCSVCKTMFYHEPFVYTYPDGKQSLCCSTNCHAFIKREEKAAAKHGGRPNEH